MSRPFQGAPQRSIDGEEPIGINTVGRVAFGVEAEVLLLARGVGLGEAAQVGVVVAGAEVVETGGVLVAGGEAVGLRGLLRECLFLILVADDSRLGASS